MSQSTIVINGVEYDSQSGLPVDRTVAATPPATPAPAKAAFTPHTPVRPSQSVHQTTEKSQTLNRQTVKKAAPKATPQALPTQPIKKSPAITKFAPHPATINKAPRMMDIAPASNRMSPLKKQVHMPKKTSPVVVRTQLAPAPKPISAPVTMQSSTTVPASTPAPAKIATSVVAAPKPSQIIKQEAIEKALATPTKKESKRRKVAKVQAKKTRALSIASASLALLMLGGYFTYLNMPSLSVRVAAAQSGVDASYPGYRPDGYSINGLVTYNKDTVSMKFAANGGPQSYTIDQTKKNWDSSAVLENYVKPKVGGSYIPYSERGLTIYTFENNAAWVNNGVFYTITGDAPLSSDQILHIASSM